MTFCVFLLHIFNNFLCILLKIFIDFMCTLLQIFNDFELEPHQDCTYDHVDIFDGDNSDTRRLGKFCGATTPDPIVATSNRMYMTFYSDASVQRKGFHATHTTGRKRQIYIYVTFSDKTRRKSRNEFLHYTLGT